MTQVAAKSSTSPLVPMGASGWFVWPEVAVRGAGFEAAAIQSLCDADLAAAADRLGGKESCEPDRIRYRNAYAQATSRLTAAIQSTARDTRFREAVTWQNPHLVDTCLDKAAAGEPRTMRGRGHESTIASYLQRYCLKNDSIGFFGPVGWGTVDTADVGLLHRAGPNLLRGRTTQLEDWAVDVVADVISASPQILPWLRPRRADHAVVSGSTLIMPFAQPVHLSIAELRMWQRCDGHWPVRELLGDPPDLAILSTLLRLRSMGAIEVGLSGPSGVRAERSLAARLETIEDAEAAHSAIVLLKQLTTGLEAVAAAAGNDVQLGSALLRLTEIFEKVTRQPATRHPGQTYAARTIVFEDTTRDVDVHIGARLTDRLAPSLGLVLDSASWLMDELAARFESHAAAVFDEALQQTHRSSMPLHLLLARALPEVLTLGQDPSAEPSPGLAHPIRDAVVDEFQRRWSRVLGLPSGWLPGTRVHHVDPATLAERAAAEFALSRPPWSGVLWHSPDIMLVAEESSLARGEVVAVLGELHCGVNTLENRLFVGSHPEPARLRRAAAESGVDSRVIFALPRGAPLVNGRLTRDDRILLPSYTYVFTGDSAMQPPQDAVKVALVDLTVQRRGEGLAVRHGDTEFSFAEIIGELTVGMLLNSFQPFPDCAHRPRVVIGSLVLARESWAFTSTDLAWAVDLDEARRYAAVRRWRQEHGLPERCFFRVSTERKPIAVDFGSLVLVNLFAKHVRRCARLGQGMVRLTEMLPDLDQLWLDDASGAHYTSELRFVMVKDRIGPLPETGNGPSEAGSPSSTSEQRTPH